MKNLAPLEGTKGVIHLLFSRILDANALTCLTYSKSLWTKASGIEALHLSDVSRQMLPASFAFFLRTSCTHMHFQRQPN